MEITMVVYIFIIALTAALGITLGLILLPVLLSLFGLPPSTEEPVAVVKDAYINMQCCSRSRFLGCWGLGGMQTEHSQLRRPSTGLTKCALLVAQRWKKSFFLSDLPTWCFYIQRLARIRNIYLIGDLMLDGRGYHFVARF